MIFYLCVGVLTDKEIFEQKLKENKESRYRIPEGNIFQSREIAGTKALRHFGWSAVIHGNTEVVSKINGEADHTAL